MQLPTVELRQAESLGRNDISAVGGLASAKGAYSSAQSNMVNLLAKVGGEFIRREETSLFKTAMTNTNNSESQFVEQEGAKEFYTGQELEGRAEGVELYNIGADANGKEIKNYKKNIPAYQVYPQLLAKKLQGDMDVYAKTIPNPIDRKAFIENRSVDIGNKVRGATLKAAREQFDVLRDESDARRDEALSNGNKEAADIEASQFDGSDFEKEQRLTENAQKYEIWTGDRLIQIEDMTGIKKMLNYLQDEKYKQKGGPLPERPNIDLQNRLRSKLRSLDMRKGGIDRVYKEELRQRAQDFIKAQEDGALKSSDEVDALRAALDGVKLQRLSIDVRRADKMSTFVDFMAKNPEVQHKPMIAEMLSEVAEGDKRNAFESVLFKKSAEFVKQIETDATGFYIDRNMSNPPNPSAPDYYAQLLNVSRLAGDQYNVRAPILPDEVATNLSRQFEYATIKAKQQFIEQVIPQIPEKADRDALFTQIDKKGAGNLNVYADIIERGEKELIKAIDEGKRLRTDGKLELLPKGIDGRLSVELNGVFKLNIERVQYREAIKDYYAKLARDDGDIGDGKTVVNIDTTRFTNAIKAVVGNIVKYDDRNFLLPNNELDRGDFEDWIDDLDYKYLDQLGGVLNMTSEEALQAIRDGDIKMYPSLTRGEYLLKDARDKYLMQEFSRQGEYVPFKFIYNRNAPQREISDWFDWGHI